MFNISNNYKKACKGTTFFSYMQACANFICEKVHFLKKNSTLFNFCFPFPTIYINFARYFG